jgi:hypothetical protein
MNNSNQVVTSGRSISRSGKMIYNVSSNKKPVCTKDNFEMSYADISDERASRIANSLLPEDQNHHQKKSGGANMRLVKSTNDNKNSHLKLIDSPCAVKEVSSPKFISHEMVTPELLEPKLSKINDENYKGSSLFRRRARQNKHA